MNDLVTARTFRPDCSSVIRLVFNQELSYRDTVVALRTVTERGSISSHLVYGKGLFVERCSAASSSRDSDTQHKIGQPTTAKVVVEHLFYADQYVDLNLLTRLLSDDLVDDSGIVAL